MKNLATMAGFNTIWLWLVIGAYFFGPSCICIDISNLNVHQEFLTVSQKSRNRSAKIYINTWYGFDTAQFLENSSTNIQQLKWCKMQ